MFFYKKAQNLSGTMLFLLMDHNRFSIIQFICFHKSVWEPNHRAPGTYAVNHAYVIKFIKMTSNSKDRAVKKHRKHGKTNSTFLKVET